VSARSELLPRRANGAACFDPSLYGAEAFGRKYETITPPIQPGFWPPNQNNVAMCISNPVGTESYVSIDRVSASYFPGMGNPVWPATVFAVLQPNTAAGAPTNGFPTVVTPTSATNTTAPVASAQSAFQFSNNGIGFPVRIVSIPLFSYGLSTKSQHSLPIDIDLSGTFILAPGTAFGLVALPPPPVPNPPMGIFQEGVFQFGVVFSEMSFREAKCLR